VPLASSQVSGCEMSEDRNFWFGKQVHTDLVPRGGRGGYRKR
jgi:hypothetical protein